MAEGSSPSGVVAAAGPGSDSLLSAALAAARLGAFEWTLASGQAVLDRRAREIFGFGEREPLDADAVFARIDPADVERVRTAALDSAAAGARLEIEYAIRLPNGDRRILLAISDAIAAADGATERMVGVVHDVTVRRDAERRLREGREELERLTDALPVLVAFVGPDHRYRFVNRIYESWFLRKREEIVGRLVRDVIGEPAYALVSAHLDRAMAGEVVEFEQLMPYRDGGARHIRVRYVPARDGEGAVSGVYALVEDISKERAARMALAANEEQLRLATEAAEVGLWDVDLVTDTLYWPPRVKAMFGISADRPVSMADFYAGLHPEDRERVAAAFATAVDPEVRGIYDVEYRTVGKEDGVLRWVAAKGRGVFDDTGRCLRVIGTAIDISARKAAEERLHEESQTLEVLNRTGAAVAAELDLERVVQLVTDAGTELTGAAFGSFFYNVLNAAGESYMLYTLSGVERSAFARFPMPRATAVFQPTFKGEGVIRSDDILKDPRYGLSEPYRGMPKGHLPVRSYLAVPVTSRSGEVLGGLFFGHAQPGRFTERHERLIIGLAGQAAVAIDNARLFRAVQQANETLEQRVAEQTAQRNRVWTMSRDLLAVMGFDGFLKAINPAWETTLGFDEATLLARDFTKQVHPDDHPAVAEVVDRLRRGETVERFEDRLRHANGSWRWISWTLVPEGEVFYAVGRDVTDERHAAAELEATQEALRQAQKMEAVGQLTGGIAHDFNNLLGAVVGNLDLIRRRPAEPERVRRFAEAGLQAAERGAKLTGQLLAFSRAQRIELRAVHVAELISGMRDLLARTLGPAVQLEFQLDEARAPVLSDPTQLEMAVLNLAINARDAMPEGGRLSIATTLRHVTGDAELSPGEYVELAVSDTGAGMTPEVVARAFDPFFTTKGVGKGTGLGLSQVYGIARQAGGAVRIDSRPGRGTTVRIFLARTETPERSGATAPGGGEAAPASAATILVVDDDPDVRGVLVNSLDALGYRVLEAPDGPAGLDALNAETPDLLVLDYAMPGMNGAEVARRARTRRPDLPILFATGYADTDEIERAAGPDAQVLRKPFHIDELQAVLAAVLTARA